MSVTRLTQDEAERLLKMIKRSLIAEINFPSRGKTEEFDVIGDENEVFSINIFRSKIKPLKYNVGARIKKNGIMLLELHINTTNVHLNPDGEKIVGNHWHIYTEDYGRSFAFPAENLEDDKFVDNTINFLIKFNVVEIPNIIYQMELF